MSRFFKPHRLLMDSAGAAGSPSGYGTATPPSNDPQTQTPGTQPPAATAGTIPPPPAAAQNAQGQPTGEPQQATPPAQPAQTPDLTGYGNQPPAATPPAGEQPPAQTPDLKLDFKGMDAEKNKDLVDFAVKNKLSPEQAQAIVDMRKAAIDKHNADSQKFEQEKQAVHARWEQELRSDTDFGGANFDHSVQLVNSFAQKHLPNLTKALTANGGRLSSSEMKEIRVLAKLMTDEGSFEQGNASPASKEHHPTDFYK